MADLSITAANVLAASDTVTKQGTCGEAITAGKAVYYDTATKKYKLGDANGATGLRSCDGVALSGGAENQPLTVAIGGGINLGAVLTAGVAYYLSDTPGGICPVADVGSGEDPVLIGMAISTSVLDIQVQDPGVTL